MTIIAALCADVGGGAEGKSIKAVTLAGRLGMTPV